MGAAGGGEGGVRLVVCCCSPGELITVENYIIRFYLSELHSETGGVESFRQVTPQSKRNTLTALGHSYLACGHNRYDSQSCTMDSRSGKVHSIIHLTPI